LGATKSLPTNSRDKALGLPTQDAVRVALRTQQILAEESGVGHTVDPLAGSYLIEHLTDEIEAQARRYLERIDGMGGAFPAIERGCLQAEIHEAAYQAQRAVERGGSVVVGVNKFQTEPSVHLEVPRLDSRVEVE